MVRVPIDPMQGIYLAQGSFTQHIIFIAVNFSLFFIEPVNYSETSLYPN